MYSTGAHCASGLGERVEVDVIGSGMPLCK